MEKVYNFIKITLLGLILGILVSLLLQVNYWAYDIKMTLRNSMIEQNKEYIKNYLEKNKKKPPACTAPNKPKYKI